MQNLFQTNSNNNSYQGTGTYISQNQAQNQNSNANQQQNSQTYVSQNQVQDANTNANDFSTMQNLFQTQNPNQNQGITLTTTQVTQETVNI